MIVESLNDLKVKQKLTQPFVTLLLEYNKILERHKEAKRHETEERYRERYTIENF